MAEAVAAWACGFAVITSVNRDDRADGGAEIVRAGDSRHPRSACRAAAWRCWLPDFQGSHAAVETVMEASPDVFNHNTETVPRLYRQVRLGARYERSLDVLAHARRTGAGDSHQERADARAWARRGDGSRCK